MRGAKCEMKRTPAREGRVSGTTFGERASESARASERESRGRERESKRARNEREPERDLSWEPPASARWRRCPRTPNPPLLHPGAAHPIGPSAETASASSAVWRVLRARSEEERIRRS